MSTEYNLIKEAGRSALIAGPCAAESRDQVIRTAEALLGTPGIIAYRAGLWKPRTRPADFEGVGEKGLVWLREVKEKTGLRLAVEIATAAHAEACLKSDIDIVWIGARSVVSPFIVDEIARALSGSDVCVMVKNPVNPDLSLWSGAIERLKKKNITHLAAVHRGFDIYYSKPYRNAPLWEIPIELKNDFPGLPVLCDPSHIGGNRELLQQISQKALDLGMDGLMIESHIEPDKALTDIAQQLSPQDLKIMISRLKIRDLLGEKIDITLEKYRVSLNELDIQLLEILAKRMELSELIGKLKQKNNLAPYQPERWSAVFNDRLKKGISLKLDEEFMKRLLNLIHMESLRRQG